MKNKNSSSNYSVNMKDGSGVAFLMMALPFALLLLFIVLFVPEQPSQKDKIAACRVKHNEMLEWKEGTLKATASHYFLIRSDGVWHALAVRCNGKNAHTCNMANDRFILHLSASLGKPVRVGFCEKHPVQIELGGTVRWMPQALEAGRHVKP